jgi:CheY-specific phosphatase CheX
MNVSESDIEILMKTVLSTMLDLEPTMIGAEARPPAGTRTLSAIIHITGAVDGAVVLHVTEAFARRVAAAMFRIDADTASITDQQDALGELCNVVGGNFKSLLPEPCRLSLPAVVEGADYSFRITGSEGVAQYGIDVDDQPLLLRLWKRDGTVRSPGYAAPKVA